MTLALIGEDLHLFRGGDVAETEAQRKAIHLRLRQRIGALKLDGVLGGDDEEQRVEQSPRAVQTHLTLAHCLEQRRLGPGRGPVDFVGEQDVGEYGPLVELEGLITLVEQRHPEDVRGQQVRRELNALEAGVDGARQGLGERRLASAGHVLEQHVAAGGEGRHELAYSLRLATHDLADILPDTRIGIGGVAPQRFRIGSAHITR